MSSVDPAAASGTTTRARTPRGGPSLAIRNARILSNPDDPPIEQGSVLVQGDRIVAVGTNVAIPSSAQVIPGEGRVVTAGFWNAHVHFTETKWRRPDRQKPALLEARLHEMFTSRGFTTVVDTGSDPRVTMRLRDRIENEGLLGPAILTSGPSIFPPRGIPFYLRYTLPWWLRPFVPTPASPRAARRTVERILDRGADLVKLFTGSYVERGKVLPMPEPVARAAVETAHARGRLVFSHASNRSGVEVAIRSGVDVLAHPPDTTEGVDEGLVRELVEHRMAMVPTLQMFERTVSTSRDYLAPIYEVVRRFHAMGGTLLFGTDVGYMPDVTVDGEFRALTGCGLDPRAILRMLTTAPAGRFGVASDVGSVVPGARADLVLLDDDPLAQPLAFTRVRATIRRGRVVHLRP